MIHLNIGSNLDTKHGSRFNNLAIAVNLLIDSKIKIKNKTCLSEYKKRQMLAFLKEHAFTITSSVFGFLFLVMYTVVGVYHSDRVKRDKEVTEQLETLSSSTPSSTPSSSLSELTGGVLQLTDRGDGIKDLILNTNLQMVSNASSTETTHKTGRIVFNDNPDDIHSTTIEKVMLSSTPGPNLHKTLMMTMKNAQNADTPGELGWVKFYGDTEDPVNAGGHLYYTTHIAEPDDDWPVTDGDSFQIPVT